MPSVRAAPDVSEALEVDDKAKRVLHRGFEVHNAQLPYVRSPCAAPSSVSGFTKCCGRQEIWEPTLNMQVLHMRPAPTTTVLHMRPATTTTTTDFFTLGKLKPTLSNYTAHLQALPHGDTASGPRFWYLDLEVHEGLVLGVPLFGAHLQVRGTGMGGGGVAFIG